MLDFILCKILLYELYFNKNIKNLKNTNKVLVDLAEWMNLKNIMLTLYK